MIVCSCNVLSDKDVRACLNPGPDCPRTPAQVYGCLGCSPECGGCARTIRAMLQQALEAAQAEAEPCQAGTCAGHGHSHPRIHVAGDGRGRLSTNGASRRP